MNSINFFFINLQRRPDRRDAIERQCERLGIQPVFVEAFDAQQLPAPPASALSSGEIACYRSHHRVWSMLVEQQLARAVVFEDDIELDARLDAVCRELAALPLDIDLIRLGSLMPVRGSRVATLSSGHQLVAPSCNGSGAHAYFLTRAGARSLLARFGEPRQPVDRVIDQAWRNGLRALVVAPPLATPIDALGSDIASCGRRAPRAPRAAWLMRKLERHWRRARAMAWAWQLRSRLHPAVPRLTGRRALPI